MEFREIKCKALMEKDVGKYFLYRDGFLVCAMELLYIDGHSGRYVFKKYYCSDFSIGICFVETVTFKNPNIVLDEYAIIFEISKNTIPIEISSDNTMKLYLKSKLYWNFCINRDAFRKSELTMLEVGW